ncbi:Disease resistance protein RPM1 [Zea mays]|jgi:hypothetical protein|uniref:Disease resistance protein RPM1 n=1 Tax=Zea mays TaxID=4577 RepID=A0A1D6I9E9_MAIZE|nr:Disease resistance protein RPM1 [Zea mays]
MQAFLSNLSKCEEGHDDQTEDWMKQILCEAAYDIEDCIDDFAHSLRPDLRASGWVTAVRKILYLIRTWYPRRNIATQIVDLKNRAQHIGERRTRYAPATRSLGRRRATWGVLRGISLLRIRT